MVRRNSSVLMIGLMMLASGWLGCAAGDSPDGAVDARVIDASQPQEAAADTGAVDANVDARDGAAPTMEAAVDVVAPPDVVTEAAVDAGPPASTFAAVSTTHACVGRADGHVFCWGPNYVGEIGDGTMTARLTPVEVTGIADAIALAAGASFSCALRADHTVSCWGNGEMMGTGVGSANALHPVAMAGLTNIVQIAASRINACALRDDGHLLCWGINQNGNAGDPGYVAAPTEVAGVTDAAQIAVGGTHRCYRSTTGSVSCWGFGQGGRLGNGDSMDRAGPTLVPGLTDAQFITAGTFATCVIVTGGAVRCWSEGSVSNDSSGVFTPAPPITALPPADRVVVGASSACARSATDGVLRCWGDEAFGALGNGVTTGSQPMPTTPTGLGPVTAFAIGDFNMVAVSGGVTYGWGQPAIVGDGTNMERSVPTPVAW